MYFAHKCLNDYQRCEICGVAGWFIRTQKMFFFGSHRMNRRLQVDHIEPFNGRNSTRENTRILCHSCNYLRGAKRRTDVQVLRIVRRWYREKYFLKLLYWLNEKPGSGGELFRNKTMQQKTVKLLGPLGLTDQMNLQIQMS